MAVQASNSNPVQWWLASCPTFNENEVSGINHTCWCAPWNCADEITNQFFGDDGLDLTIIALNSNNEIIFEENVPEIASGVYQVSFVPEDEDICNEKIQLYLLSEDNATELIQDPTFDTGTGWSNTGSGDAWSVTSGRAEVTGLTVSSVSRFFSDSFADTTGLLTLNFSAQLRYASGVNTKSATLLIAFIKDGEEVKRITENFAITDVLPAHVITKSYTITESVDQVIFQVSGASGGGTWDFWMTDFSLIEYNLVEGLKSDCLHIKTNHEGTNLFEYSNNRNFDGIVYEDISPPLSFFIRVPSVFFHNRYPQEDKAIERTSSTVITSSKFKKQKLLQVEHAPDYFHEKLIKVLSHHNVEALGKQWKKEEAYDKEDGDPKYPLKTATCYLTDKNSLRRNVL